MFTCTDGISLFDHNCMGVHVKGKELFHHVKGLGIGTVVAAFTMGKAIGLVGRWLDKKFDFVSFMKK